MKTIVALFDNVSHAGQTAQNLDSIGVDRDDIHLIVRQAESTYESLLDEALGNAALSEEEVTAWRQRVNQGGALLVVHVDDDLAAEAREIMDRNNAGRSWEEIEPEAQRHWEARRRGEWSQFKDAVRHAWDEIRDTSDWRVIDEEVQSTKRGQQYRHLKEEM